MENLEGSNAKLVAGANFYCEGVTGMGTVLGGFSIDTQNSANHIQVRINYAEGDSSKYQLQYTLNNENKNFSFTPENNIFSQEGEIKSLSCSLEVPADEGNRHTFCSISLFEV